jgi:dephospho-CoA kinase
VSEEGSVRETMNQTDATAAETIEERFQRLAAEWENATAYHSSTTVRINHPAYREIIRMGIAVVPLLLKDMEEHHTHWFWALKDITKANPIPASARGDIPAMVQAWLDWAKEHDYRAEAAQRGKPVIGLIGGIGSGKSHVAAEFARHGAAVIAGDQLGHEALRQPDVRDRVVERWGSAMLDASGQVDRRALGQRVFADPAELRALEKLVFPWIEGRIEEEIRKSQQTPAVRFVVLDAAIMLEAGWNRFCDWIVYVDTPREERLQRLAQQRGWTEKEVQARSEAQLPLTAKVSQADAAIDNAGSASDLARQIVHLLQRWRIPVAS